MGPYHGQLFFVPVSLTLILIDYDTRVEKYRPNDLSDVVSHKDITSTSECVVLFVQLEQL